MNLTIVANASNSGFTLHVELCILRMAIVTREQETEFSVIGKRNPKIEAHQKASGQTKYAGDLKLPRMQTKIGEVCLNQ